MNEQSTAYVYEDEIDLRHYIDTLLQWWREILTIALLCAIAAGVISTLQPRIYEATASVAVVRERSTLNLGSALTTLNEEDLTATRSQAQNTERRNTLAQLVSNPVIAEQVIGELGEAWFGEDEIDPARLVRKIKAEAAGDTDLIVIRVRDRDPAKAAELVTTWARAYVSFANALYSSTTGNYDVIVVQLRKSESEYGASQTVLEAFVKDNRIDELNRLIAEKQAVVDRLQADKQSVLTVLFDSTWEEGVLESRLDVLLADEAFGGDGVFSKALTERIRSLARDYSLKRHYEVQLVDVLNMREQLSEGGDPANNALALLLLKAEIFETAGELPSSLQLQFAGPVTQTLEAQLTDLAALASVMTEKINELDRAVAAEYDSLSQDMAYGFEAVAVSDPADFVNVTLETLQIEIQTQQAELEAQEARQRELTAERDLAWESYQGLARREAELRVNREVPDSEVRFATPATVPLAPVTPQRLRNTALAGVVGGVLGVGIAFLMAYMDRKPFFRRAAHPATGA